MYDRSDDTPAGPSTMRTTARVPSSSHPQVASYRTRRLQEVMDVPPVRLTVVMSAELQVLWHFSLRTMDVLGVLFLFSCSCYHMPLQIESATP